MRGLVAWHMSIALLWAIFIAVVAYAQPAELEAAKKAVDDRLQYAHYTHTLSVVGQAIVAIGESHKPAGLPDNAANCVDFAKAYKRELGRGVMRSCITPDGEGHAYLQVGEWALDNRERWVVKTKEVCK